MVSVASGDMEDSGSKIADLLGAVPYAAPGEYLPLPIFPDAAVLAYNIRIVEST